MSKRRPTIDDVAAHSGVARTTVSRVLNNGPNVRAEVRARVMASVAALGYRVNQQARMLAGGSTGLVALIHAFELDAEPNSYYHSGLELGAMRACAELGLSLHTRTISPVDAGRYDKILDLITRMRCIGMILSPPFSDDETMVQQIIDAACPLICISAGPQVQAMTASVGMDDAAAGYALGQHILEQGHRTIAYIDGPEGHISAGQRLIGFRRCVAEAGLPADALQVMRGNFTFHSGITIAETILSHAARPSALVCANDDMAAGALLTAHRLGLNIPQDLAVAGFDDTPVSEIVWPPLSTVHQPIRRMGARAVERIAEAVNRGRDTLEPGFEAIDFVMVKRASTCGAMTGNTNAAAAKL
ncbi:MAG: LacI family DNA-binding transcriptional regulator [Sphingopyxis sp.]